MSEYMKLIDPGQRWIWTHPALPDVRFEYKALAGPTLTRDLARRYLDGCITRAWCVEIPGVGPVDEWSAEAGPAVEWSKVLPSDVANALFLAVAAVSRLTPDESRDSRSPSGLESTGKTTTAIDAGITAPDGSAHDGKTKQTKAGNGSAPKRPKQAGAR